MPSMPITPFSTVFYGNLSIPGFQEFEKSIRQALIRRHTHRRRNQIPKNQQVQHRFFKYYRPDLRQRQDSYKTEMVIYNREEGLARIGNQPPN